MYSCCARHYVLSHLGIAPDLWKECGDTADDFQGQSLPQDAQALFTTWHQEQEQMPSRGIFESAITPLKKDLIPKASDAPHIQFYHSQHQHRVFELKELPGWIYKMTVDNDGPSEMYERFFLMMKGQTFIRVNELALTVIPLVQIFPIHFDGLSLTVLVEQKLHFDSRREKQKELLGRDCMNPALWQLWRIIRELHLDDVNMRNIAVLERTDQIGVFDFECIHMDAAPEIRAMFGLLGTPHHSSCGLIGCMSLSQLPLIGQMAQELNIFSQRDIDKVLEKRKIKIQAVDMLKAYHLQHNIVDGTEPLSLKSEDIDFSDAPSDMVDKLQQWTRTLIDKINLALSRPLRQNETIRNHRILTLTINTINQASIDISFINNGKALENPQGKILHFSRAEEVCKFVEESKQYQNKWVTYLLNKLVAYGALYNYNFEKNSFPSYKVQF
jgi:hypothetical protein